MACWFGHMLSRGQNRYIQSAYTSQVGIAKLCLKASSNRRVYQLSNPSVLASSYLHLKAKSYPIYNPNILLPTFSQSLYEEVFSVKTHQNPVLELQHLTHFYTNSIDLSFQTSTSSQTSVTCTVTSHRQHSTNQAVKNLRVSTSCSKISNTSASPRLINEGRDQGDKFDAWPPTLCHIVLVEVRGQSKVYLSPLILILVPDIPSTHQAVTQHQV